jgi:RHS repeat-associated protein
MNRSIYAVCVAVTLFAVLTVSPAQVPTGTPPFGSFGGGPFDVVNLGNLNAHFDINVRTKAGRGMPFTYDITYDTSIWYPPSASGVQTWQPVAGYGWNFPLGVTGFVTNQIVTQSSQPCNPPSNMEMINFTVYSFYVYTDPTGQTHPFSTAFELYQSNSCGLSGAGSTNTATDGSGYVLTIAKGTGYVTVTGPNGMVYVQGSVGPSTSGTVTDSNGNEITTNNGTFTDTLGQTALSLSGTNPIYLQYTAPNGKPAEWTINYSPYNIETNFGCSGVAEYTKTGVELPQSITLPDGTSYNFTYENTAGHSGYTTGRLLKVTLPTGGSITYTYPTTNSGANNGINCADGSAPPAANGNPSLTRAVSPGGTWNYYRTDVSGNHWQTKITSPPDPSVGDDTVIDFQQDSSTGYGDTHNFFETQRQVFQGSQSSGTILSTTITCYNTSGPMLPANCPTTSVSTPISRVTALSYLPNTSGRVSETDTQYSQYSDPAYPSEIDSYDYGTTAGTVGPLIRKVLNGWGMLGGATNPTIVLSSTTVEDASSNVRSFVNYQYGQTVTGTSGTPQHTTPYGTRANLTMVQEQVTGGSSPTYLYRVFTYYDTGMLNTATDWGTTNSGGPNLTTYNYSTASFSSENTTQSCGNSFVTSLSEPLSLTRSFTWDCWGGVQTSVTDENGQTSSVYYTGSNFGMSADPYYWRPYATTDPLNYATTLSYPSNTVTESALLFNNSNSVVDQRIKLDTLGRLILSQMKEGPTSSSYDSTQTDYDIFGRVSENSLPFTNTADATCTGTCPGVTTTYDALNRPYTVTDGGGGTTTYAYTNNDVYQALGPAPSGENTKRKQLQYDGLGRLSSVCEITSTSNGGGTCSQTNTQTGFWTTYSYDVLGDMIGVTQNAQASSTSQQTRTYTFDMLGRMVTELNPETGTALIAYTYDRADSGCASYVSAGDLVEKRDAMGNITCMHYDALHRVTQTTYPSGTYASVTPTKCYVYDSATVNSQSMTNAKTRLAEAYTTSASSCPGTVTVDEGFSYSARGEVSDVWEETPDSGGYYHVNATYWAHGRLNVLNGGTSPLPGLPAITYGASNGSGLDGKGRIIEVTAASGQNPATSISWNAGNQVTGVTLGSGDSDAYQYDPNTGRMNQYQFNTGTGPQSQTGKLTWNANWTLGQLQITDQINTANSQTCTYSHDDLTRIASVNCGSAWSQVFALDPFGNLSKSGSAQFLPTYTGASGTSTSPTNQYYQISGGGSGTSNYYDTNGNLKNDVTNNYTWDADGNMLSVGGSTSVTMIYDALDRMIEQTRSSGHTEIVYGPRGRKLALMNGQTLVNAFVKLPGGPRAVYGSSGLAYYRHSDHLGNSRLATTTSQTKQYDVAYAPYGEDYNGSGTQDLAFTHQNQDTVKGGWSTNLYDFMFREYRTAHGRWTSPDPAGLGAVDPTNPQGWNRYAYVLNNPLAMVDPLGLDDDECYDEGCPDGDDGDEGGGGGNGGGGGVGAVGSGPGGAGTIIVVQVWGTPLPSDTSCNGTGQFCNNLNPYGSQTCDLSTGMGCPPPNPPQNANPCPPGQNCSGRGGGGGGGGGNGNGKPSPQPSPQQRTLWQNFTHPTAQQCHNVNIAVKAEAVLAAGSGATGFLFPVTAPIAIPAGLGMGLSAAIGGLWGAIACP